MSPKNPPLIVGLAAPGLLWLATSVAFGQDPPPAPPGPPTQAPTPSSHGSIAYRALLLSNGKVVQGDIVEDAAAGLYQLRQNGGVVGYPKFKVLKAGESTEELYRFQVARLPDGDADERMKLARWCLTEHLTSQAREQLEAIQAMSPGDAEVGRMLYNLAATADRTPVDPDVRRTSGEMPRGEAPATLDPRVISRAQKRFTALPEIFDLPQVQAVKRANEFVDFVQPVLQQACARCHGEKYQGEFQLVEVKLRRDQANSDIARSNLDATLRLINPDDPARSQLLSAGLVPHGGSKSAIFRGPNDRNYQVLATWAKSLRATKAPNGAPAGARASGDGVARTGYASPDVAPVGGFASERPGRQASPAGQPAIPEQGEATLPMLPPPPPRAMVERYDESAEFVAGEKPEFPSPYSVGGKSAPRPAPPRAKAAPKPPAPGGPASPPKAPARTAKTATPNGPNSVVVTTDNPNELPGMDLPRYRPKSEDDGEVDRDPAAKKKPKPIDPALLEKMMKSRNGGTP